MTSAWFLQGAIICTIIGMGKYGDAIIEVKHTDDDYFEELNLLNRLNDEKAFKRMNDQIIHFLIQENEKGPPKNNEGPRRYFYQKYMKIGKHKITTLSDNSKDSFEQQTTHKNKFLGTSYNLVDGNGKDNSKGKIQMVQVPTFRTNENDYNSMYHKSLANLQHKVLKQNKYDNNKNRRLAGINYYISNLNKKETESNLSDENRLSYYDELHNKLEGRRKDIENRNGKEMHKPEPIKNPLYLENVAKSEKVHEENIEQPLADHRRIRSCELRMEDIQESYMPNEQLSIYHPKMSMTDQFVLSDTMF